PVPAGPGAATALLPQQGRLRHRPHRQRASRSAFRRAAPAERTWRALRRYAARRRGSAAGAVLVRPRLLLRRHGGPRGVRLVPALPYAEEAARRALHVGGPRPAGHDALLS